jgi:hypothetical protein
MSRFGGIVILWAYVEQWLGGILGHLLESNPALFHVVTNGVSNSTVVDWLRTLIRAHEYPDEPPREIMDLLTTVDELRAERNALVHGLWKFGEPGTALVQTIKLERSEIIKHEIVTLADLDELFVAIRETKEGVEALGARFGYPPMVPGHPAIIKP